MRQFCVLFFALALFQRAGATDRVVSTTGLYPTIGDALEASSDGDRILVEPGIYPDPVVIKKGISLLPNTEGGRYTVTGPVWLSMISGKTIDIQGMRAMAGLSRYELMNTRTEVRIRDSYIWLLNLQDPYIHTDLLRDTIGVQADVYSVTAIGNVFMGESTGGAFFHIHASTALPDDIILIGNHIGASIPGYGLVIDAFTRIVLENNYIRSIAGWPAFSMGIPTAAAAITVTPSRIVNNTFFRPAGAGTAISRSNAQEFNLLMRNNASIGYTDGLFNIPASHGQVSNNLLVAPSAILASTGAPSAGSPLIDAGDPDPRYLDLDLTTNDVGCYGGSNSRANFSTPMGSAVVGFMQAPRVVSQGDAVNINAVGFDR